MFYTYQEVFMSLGILYLVVKDSADTDFLSSVFCTAVLVTDLKRSLKYCECMFSQKIQGIEPFPIVIIPIDRFQERFIQSGDNGVIFCYIYEKDLEILKQKRAMTFLVTSWNKYQITWNGLSTDSVTLFF